MGIIERGTRLHLSYGEAFDREMKRMQIAYIPLWIGVLVIWWVPAEWVTISAVVLALYFLFLLKHWRLAAVRHRAWMRAQKEKPWL